MEIEPTKPDNNGNGAVAEHAGPGRFSLVKSDREVERKFQQYLEAWRQDTPFESNYKKLVSHPSFRRLVALGPQVVPLILKDMELGHGGVWFQVLEDFTEENPIPAKHESDTSLMTADWLEWGKMNGLI